MSMSWRQQAFGVGVAALLTGISPGGSVAQSALTGTVLSGASLSGAGGSARLVLGSRVTSPPRSWTEVVFSDGSSIVLGPGAELTVHQIASDRISAAGSGQIRIVAMDGMAVELGTPGATVTVMAADAVLQAVPHGSVAMMGGREVVVSQGTRREALRRPGFSVTLDGSGTQRDSTRQIVAALAPFGSSGPTRSPAAAEATAPPAPSAPRKAQSTRRGPALAAAPSALALTEISTARADDLTTGLTAQAGSFTSSPALRVSVPAAATSIAAVAASTTNSTASTVPVSVISTPAPNMSVPDLNYSSYTPTAAAGAPAPSFAAVDSTLLAGIPGTVGPITLPGTTTSVSAGLVPSNEHLTWGFFVSLEGSVTPATALAGPGLSFKITSTALPAGSLQTLTGTATYTGGLIANTGGTSGYLTGQFAQTWNFGTRSGALNAIFDGSTWRGVALTMPSATNVYSANGISTTDQRSITIQGGFYNNTSVSPGSFPGAAGGTFSVGGSSTGRLSAEGIFVGTRR